jgi:hypothetical protein
MKHLHLTPAAVAEGDEHAETILRVLVEAGADPIAAAYALSVTLGAVLARHGLRAETAHALVDLSADESRALASAA